MKHWRTILLWGGLLAVLAVVNRGIVERERILDHGRVLLLELEPEDPRSLMQGDYMALRFAASDDIRETLHPAQSEDGMAASALNQPARVGGQKMETINRDGYAVFAIDKDGVGRFVRLQTSPQPAGAGEVVVFYRKRGWREVRIASNAWFFAEGQAERFQPARYGELRVAGDGSALITGLRDGHRKPL